MSRDVGKKVQGKIVVTADRWSVAMTDDCGLGETNWFHHGVNYCPAALFRTRSDARKLAKEAAKGGGKWTVRRVKVRIEEATP